MQKDVDSLLNDLLAQWHQWADRYKYGKGYPSADVACRSARASRQYDDQNGALDADIDMVALSGVDAAMNRIREQNVDWYTVLSIQARNMACCVNVWSSPRIPADIRQRANLLVAARTKLKQLLALDGVLPEELRNKQTYTIYG